MNDFANTASLFIIVAIIVCVVCATIFFLFRGSLQERDSTDHVILFSETQKQSKASQKSKQKTGKASSKKSSKPCLEKSEAEVTAPAEVVGVTPKEEPAEVEKQIDVVENVVESQPNPPTPTPPPSSLPATVPAKKGPSRKPSKGSTQRKSVEVSSHNGALPYSANQLLTTLSTLTDMQNKVKQLEKNLKQHKADLEASRQETAKARSESAKLRQRNEEVVRATETLRTSIADLKERNEAISKERRNLEDQVKTLDLSCCSLRSQLTATKAEANNQLMIVKAEADDLRNQLSNAMEHTNFFPPRPSSKEIMVMTEENLYLKSRLEQVSLELQQMKNTNAFQQSELTTLRANRLEQQLNNRSNLTNLNNLRLRNAQLEAQLQQCTMELEIVNQRNQEYASALTGLQAERLDQDRNQARLISSIQFQFGDLNAEKHRLSDAILKQRTSAICSLGELQAQVARLTQDLAAALSEAAASRQRADQLAAQVDELTAAAADVIVVAEPPSVDVVAKLESDYARAEADANGARRQLELAQTTLMQTEAVLARLQRSIEEEEGTWRSRLVATLAENARLKAELGLIHENSEANTASSGDESSSSLKSDAHSTEPNSTLQWDESSTDSDTPDIVRVVSDSSQHLFSPSSLAARI